MGVRANRRLAAVLAWVVSLAPSAAEAEDEPQPSACPGVDELCESLALADLMRAAVWAPAPLVGGFVDPAPRSVAIEFCVEPSTGRTRRIRSAQPWLGHPRVTQLLETVAAWRFRPIVVDGRPVLACSRIVFEIAVSPTPAEPGPFEPPVVVFPAIALYTPGPTAKQLRTTRFLRWRDPGGLSLWGYNVTAYCVDQRGRTFDVRTEKRFGHSPEVDELLRATIARWRFKPMIVAGVPRTSCMKQGFVIMVE